MMKNEIIDKSNMYQVLLDFPKQISEGLKIGENAPAMAKTNEFVLLGMGGSAIGGDILSSYFANTKGLDHIRINVNRDYGIPGYINENTAVITSSYSGNTEETITALKAAAKKTNNILCITSGGKLREIAEKENYPLILIPGGFMPRCALGYSFFSLLKVILKSADIDDKTLARVNKEIDITESGIKEKSKDFANIDDSNPAYQLAVFIYNTITVIYSSNRLNAVNARWRAQIQENSKNLCFGNVLPEMTHNEINSWRHPEQLLKGLTVILLREKIDNEKIAARFDAVKKLLDDKTAGVISLEIESEYYLLNMFNLIVLGDWASYFLALLNKEDPTPIPLIEKFKEMLV